MIALGLIESVGYTTAVSAADAAVKAANVEIIGLEKVIGVNGYVSVTIHLTGDVAAVTSAVEAGKKQAEVIGGQLVSTQVIPRAHNNVYEKLISKFAIKNDEKEESSKKKPVKQVKKDNKTKKTAKADTEKPEKQTKKKVDKPEKEEKIETSNSEKDEQKDSLSGKDEIKAKVSSTNTPNKDVSKEKKDDSKKA